jgi:hypothetical protein
MGVSPRYFQTSAFSGDAERKLTISFLNLFVYTAEAEPRLYKTGQTVAVVHSQYKILHRFSPMTKISFYETNARDSLQQIDDQEKCPSYQPLDAEWFGPSLRTSSAEILE